jgi:crossover junction endodeoxyribonuclease RuvC
VKAAITGYGSADKRQVQAMVARILGLAETPKPADAADALALAICHAWRTPVAAPPGARSALLPTVATGRKAALTPAQEAWRAAEKGAATSVPPRRLSK